MRSSSSLTPGTASTASLSSLRMSGRYGHSGSSSSSRISTCPSSFTSSASTIPRSVKLMNVPLNRLHGSTTSAIASSTCRCSEDMLPSSGDRLAQLGTQVVPRVVEAVLALPVPLVARRLLLELLRVDAVHPEEVLAEHLALDLVGELRVAQSLDHVLRHLEVEEPLDHRRRVCERAAGREDDPVLGADHEEAAQEIREAARGRMDEPLRALEVEPAVGEVGEEGR